jgi:hypothetical protein
MDFRKRIINERQRYVETEEPESSGDPLFEREWEVFVVRRDPETGRFYTETLQEELQADPA